MTSFPFKTSAKGSAPKPTGGPICQASHAAPKLGRNIRLVTRRLCCGQPWTGRAFEIPIRRETRTEKLMSHQRGSTNVYADLGYKSTDEMLVIRLRADAAARSPGNSLYRQSLSRELVGGQRVAGGHDQQTVTRR